MGNLRQMTLLRQAALFAVVAAACSANADWPLVTVRHNSVVNERPEMLAGEMEVNRRHPGACDEIWFCGGYAEPLPELTKIAESFGRYRKVCEQGGVLLSYQQGHTIGHGVWATAGKTPFTEDAWQVDRNGKRLYGLFCPRSPEVLAHERSFAKAIVATAHPASYWLDDDLRMGVCKPEGCFCERCLAAFNAKVGGGWTRGTLTAKLFGSKGRERVRAEWLDFNQESLALFAAAAREGAEEADPNCRMGYQAVWSDTIYTGRDNRKLLEALSGPNRREVGIRPGALHYADRKPCDMLAKAMSVAREAERCRGYGFVGCVRYEQESYPRRILQKSPGAVVTECALALASGCNALSCYWYIGETEDPMDEYERGAKAMAAARPYFERLVASVNRTRLVGVSRFVGSAAAETPDFDLRDETDVLLALCGIPVTVAEAGYPLWYLTEKSRREMLPEDHKTVAGRTVKVPDGLNQPPVPGFLKASERKAMLDEIDRVTGGKFPVRLVECRPVRILPRAVPGGQLDCVTLLNCSIGETDGMTLKVRNPAGFVAEFMTAKAGTPMPLVCEPSGTPGEWVVRLPSLAGWQIATVFFRQ